MGEAVDHGAQPGIAARSTPDRGLPLAGLVIGVWAVLPPYVGPRLNVEPRVEFADHVVPGVVVIALSLAAVVAGARAARASTPMFVAGLAVVLAAVWMIATHVPLLAQASRGEVSYFAALYHTAPGVAVAALGGAWVARNWGDAGTPAGALPKVPPKAPDEAPDEGACG